MFACTFIIYKRRPPCVLLHVLQKTLEKWKIRVKVKKKKKTAFRTILLEIWRKKKIIAVSPIHHKREVYIWPNSSGHKADQLADIQLFQVWTLHSSTFANIDYLFVCVSISSKQLPKQITFRICTIALPEAKAKHILKHTQKIYLANA